MTAYMEPPTLWLRFSPRTAKRDRDCKKDIYAKAGVREYWVDSLGEKTVEVYLSQNRKLVFSDFYCIYPESPGKMIDGQHAGVEKNFICSLFDDLEISLDDIFSDLI